MRDWSAWPASNVFPSHGNRCPLLSRVVCAEHLQWQGNRIEDARGEVHEDRRVQWTNSQGVDGLLQILKA